MLDSGRRRRRIFFRDGNNEKPVPENVEVTPDSCLYLAGGRSEKWCRFAPPPPPATPLFALQNRSCCSRVKNENHSTCWVALWGACESFAKGKWNNANCRVRRQQQQRLKPFTAGQSCRRYELSPKSRLIPKNRVEFTQIHSQDHDFPLLITIFSLLKNHSELLFAIYVMICVEL